MHKLETAERSQRLEDRPLSLFCSAWLYTGTGQWKGWLLAYIGAVKGECIKLLSKRHRHHHLLGYSLRTQLYVTLTNQKGRTILQRERKNPISVFLSMELGGHSPNFHIHVSVSDLYIPSVRHVTGNDKDYLRRSPEWFGRNPRLTKGHYRVYCQPMLPVKLEV